MTEQTNALPNGYSLTWDDTTPIPAVPANISATAGNAEVTVSWDAVPKAASYTVYWKTAAGVTTADSSIDAGSSTSITHSSLANGTPYYYRVLATNAGGTSDLSVEALATPTAPAAVSGGGGGAFSPLSIIALLFIGIVVRLRRKAQ